MCICLFFKCSNIVLESPMTGSNASNANKRCHHSKYAFIITPISQKSLNGSFKVV